MTSGERQHYWLLAIQTAQNAKLLREQWEQQQTEEETPSESGQVTINFWHLIEVRDVSCVPPLVCLNTNPP